MPRRIGLGCLPSLASRVHRLGEMIVDMKDEQAKQGQAQAKQIEVIERRLAKQSSSCFGCFGGGRTVPDTTDGVRV